MFYFVPSRGENVTRGLNLQNVCSAVSTFFESPKYHGYTENKKEPLIATATQTTCSLSPRDHYLQDGRAVCGSAGNFPLVSRQEEEEKVTVGRI